MTSTTRTILITGASNGIGAALAEHYAEPGITLALTARNAERLATVASRCNEKGAQCFTQTFDVRDSTTLIKWIGAIDRATPIDLAILNAGLAATRTNPKSGESADEMIAQISTNLGGTLLATQTIAGMMVKRGRGHLALVSSLNGLFPVVEAPTYSATKAGIIAYGEAIREWLEPEGVFVTTICPGFVSTGIAERYSGPRPLQISAQRAAVKIAAGLSHHRRRISFPLPLIVLIHLSKIVPLLLRRRILRTYSAQLTPLGLDDTRKPPSP